jgi:ubiquinone/menaquinone biosynthesis C-methylase UbiE
MNGEAKRAYFDGIADQWDGWGDQEVLAGRLAAGLEGMGLEPHETVVDVGCGTGNLSRAVLVRLSAAGRIVAVDISTRMLEVAKKKVRDPRVQWINVDAARLPLREGSVDRVLCYSVWPHFDRPAAAVEEFLRVLRPGSMLHIWHLASRRRINEIHASAGEAVRGDLLPDAAAVSRLLEEGGFTVTEACDGEEHYLVTAKKSSSS